MNSVTLSRSGRLLTLIALAAMGLAQIGCGGHSRASFKGPVDSNSTVERDLSWHPPALGHVHYPRRQAHNYLPGRQGDDNYHNRERHIDQASRSGRHRFPFHPGH